MALEIISSIQNTLTLVYNKQIQENINLVTGVEGEVGNIKTSLRKIEEVVNSYNSADRITDGDENDIQEWKEKAVDVAYELEDLLDDWNVIIIRHQYEAEDLLANFCRCFESYVLCFRKLRNRHEIAVRLKKLNETFNLVNKETERIKLLLNSSGTKDSSGRNVSTYFVVRPEIFGREMDKKDLINKLVVPLPKDSVSVPIIKITGLGGIGKTGLCQLVFNSKKIRDRFDKRRVWVSVGKNFDGVKICKDILEGLKKEHKDGSTLQQYIVLMRQCIEQRFLIVLDDVWEVKKDEWDQIRDCLMHGCDGSNSSKILITTRFDHIATTMRATDMVPIGLLSNEYCWDVIRYIALQEKKEADIARFKILGMSIAKKCKGLPLAAKVLGNYLKSRQTVDEWQIVAQTELWKLKAAKDIFSSLSLSWNNLPPDLRRCFSYCSVFPTGKESQVDNMIRMWMAHGYIKSNNTNHDELEIQGLWLYNELAKGTFLELLKEDHEIDDRITSWTMPPIMYDYAQYVSSKECCILTGPENDKSSEKARHLYVNCDDSTSLGLCLKGVHDTKKARSLFMETDHIDELILRLIFQLKCLRVLSFRDTHLKELLKEIGNLARLRFLDVSQTQLTTLPDTICDLFNLQTLCCGANVERLPLLIGRLKRLRHLISTNEFMVMPESIEHLTNLRCLPLYGVRKDTNKLGYLRRLNQIRGSMNICFLEALEQEQDIEEAKCAELGKKKISQLVLDFQENAVSLDVVEALKPPPLLRSLSIKNFCSPRLPVWLSSFNSLSQLKLHHRSGFRSLPTDLWKLEALERLSITNITAERLTKLEFFGIKEILGTGGSLFPNLTALTLQFWDNFTEWEDIGDEEDISIMPLLQKLSVSAKNINKLPFNILTKASKLEGMEFNGQPIKVPVRECSPVQQANALPSLNRGLELY